MTFTILLNSHEYFKIMAKMKNKKVFVGLSGGVDSSVAAYLLQKQDYDVTGVFIRSYNIDGCAERDTEDARRAAAHLGIPFYVFDFEKEYKKEVVEYMVNGYRNGLTPNPDVMCNKEIKFGLFLKKALEMGADYIATGHYVRKITDNCQLKTNNVKPDKKFEKVISYELQVARDSAKDQSYFLWTLTQEQLRYCLFPIGDYLKPEVRKIAREAGLPTAEKKDSQGICFLGNVELDEFLKDYIKPKKGSIIDTDGNKIGEHMGTQFYTVGQRHLGAKYQNLLRSRAQDRGANSKFQKPFYVVSKDVKTNTLVVAEGDDNPALFKKEIEIVDAHFVNPEFAGRFQVMGYKLNVLARVRYRQPLLKAKLQRSSVNSYQLIFERPVKFVAPGQSAVFYEAGFFAGLPGRGLRGRRMLGGGIISL